MDCKRKAGKCTAVLLTLCMLILGGCKAADGTASIESAVKNTDAGGSQQADGTSSAISNEPVSVQHMDSSDMFSERDKEIGYDDSTAVTINLTGTGAQCSSDSVQISGSTVVISEEHTYIITGSLTDGQIIVDATNADKIQLVLSGVNINCNTSAALYIKQADKVFITLATDTENTLSTIGEFVAIDENAIDGVIFSKDDLTLNGMGTLAIHSAYGHGIVAKDDLVITSGNYEITAASQALSGKESIRIADGSFSLTAGKDGLHAENADDASLGFLYIAGGSFLINSAGDGMQASAALQIDGGNFQIAAGGGYENGEEKQSENNPFWGNSTSAEENSGDSAKGIKASGNMMINGGSFEINSADDALHSNANLSISAGTFTISTGDDGMHADENTAISGGTITIAASYEGIEGQSIDISGGEISINSSDDGLNAAGGADASGFGGGGQDRFAADGNSYIHISGGSINLNADGDGVDSNGKITVSGGETYVTGPTSNANATLDFDGTAEITGGTFVAVGAAGMAQNFGDSSTQGAILVNISGEAGTALTLADSAGNVWVSYTPDKSYTCAVISSPEILQGETYTITAGGQSVTVEMTGIIYGSSGMGGMGNPGGARR